MKSRQDTSTLGLLPKYRAQVPHKHTGTWDIPGKAMYNGQSSRWSWLGTHRMLVLCLQLMSIQSRHEHTSFGFHHVFSWASRFGIAVSAVGLAGIAICPVQPICTLWAWLAIIIDRHPCLVKQSIARRAGDHSPHESYFTSVIVEMLNHLPSAACIIGLKLRAIRTIGARRAEK